MSEISEAIFREHKIHTSSPSPYHIQVYQALEKIILNDLEPGDQLPGEPRLCDLFGVSRTVIRQALSQLLRDGLIVRIMGKGTFVAQPKINEALIGSLTGFYEDMTQQGYTPVSQVLRQERILATPKIAHHLKLNVNEPIIVLKRVRLVNDEPLQLVTNYIPENLCPSLLHADFTVQSLYAYLREQCKLFITSGTRFIEAVLANEEESQLLKIHVGSPLILVDSVSYLEDGTAIEYFHAVHRSDRVRFQVDLRRREDY